MVKRSFLTELDRGVEGEVDLIAYFQSRGFTIEDWAETEAAVTNKGPKINGFIKPDLLVSKDGNKYWVDSKRKDAPVFYGKAREWRHGIDSKCYWEYLGVEHSTSIPVWIAFIEPYNPAYQDAYSRKLGIDLPIGGVWFVPLDAQPVKQDYSIKKRYDMVYWDRAIMRKEIL